MKKNEMIVKAITNGKAGKAGKVVIAASLLLIAVGSLVAVVAKKASGSKRIDNFEDDVFDKEDVYNEDVNNEDSSCYGYEYCNKGVSEKEAEAELKEWVEKDIEKENKEQNNIK